MADEMLERRTKREPHREPSHRTGRSAHRADGRPVGQHHSTNLAIRRPDRPDHAQRPEPPLRHYREAGDRQQADEGEPDGGKQQHGQRLVPLLLRRGCARRH